MAAEMKANVVFGAKGADAVSAAANRVNHDLEKVSKSAGRLNGAFRGMRGGAAQLGYQIQDVAVQLQSGQNALLVFGQQGSQIASIMGPGGALIGAFIAVGAAIGSALLPSLFDAEEGLYDIAAALEEVKKKQGELSNAIRLELIKQQTAEIEKLEKQLQSERDAINSNSKSAQRYNYNLDLLTGAYGNLGPNVQQGAALNLLFAQSSEEAADNNITHASSVELLEKRLREAREELEKLQAGDNPFVEPDKDVESLRKKTEGFIESLMDQAATYDMSRAEALRYHVDNMELTDQQKGEALALISVLEQKIAAEKRLTEAQKARKDLEKKAGGIVEGLSDVGMSEIEKIKAREQEKLDILQEAQMKGIELEMSYAEARKKINEETAQAIKATQMVAMQGAMSFIQGQLSFLQQAVGESSAAGKALFAINQGLAIANAIISTEAAAAKALELGPILGPPMSAIVRALGYASVGAIAGQTVAGFEGGGITFNGVRSGGLDGKGGRMAMVHPNEKITDLEKDGVGVGAPVNVSFNISAVDAKGVDELLLQRRALITNLVNKAINNRGRSSLA